MINKQKGFILVTSLVLLSILTLLGSAAAFKTVIEAKVSRMSGEGVQAFVAANAGLQKQFYEWAMDDATPADGDRTELVAALDDVRHTQSRFGAYMAAGIYAPRVTPVGIDDFRVKYAGGDIDNYIQNATNIRVFELTSTGITMVANSDWHASGKEGVQQVAVWAASFEKKANDEEYPYVKNSVDCIDCSLALYALGRYGGSYRMVRQKVTNDSLPKLEGVNAMLNAPPANDFNGVCGTGTTAGSANGEIWDPAVTGPQGLGNVLIDGTQAPYQIGTTPSGTILASNTNLATGNKGFRHGKKSQLGATFDNAPYLMYSGHNTKSAFKIDFANTKVDTTAVDLPANMIPTRLTNSPLLGTADQVNYFVDPNHQLFSMDTYRWAAEQFTCQDVNKNDGEYGNGNYCSRAEDLRKAVKLLFPDAVAPVTGRLTVNQFQWNIAHGIPMFGFVRVMFPTEQGDPPATTATCNDKTFVLHVIEGKPKKARGPYTFKKLGAEGTYTGSVDSSFIGGISPDDDGQLGTNARLIVYGSLLVDYFADYDICTIDKKYNMSVVCNSDSTNGAKDFNSTFDPEGGERLLSPLESPDVYLAVEHTIMINPAMPRFEGQDPLPIPTAANGSGLDHSGEVNMVDLNGGPRQTNKVNLASPYDGYFPWSEGILPTLPEGPAGTMRLMSRATPQDNPGGVGYISVAKAVGINNEVTSLPSGMATMLGWSKPKRTGQSSGTEADVLRYYYDMMKAVSSTKYVQDYPIAPWPGNNLADNFCIGVEDCGTADPAASSWNNNMGDKAHLMFPKGYMHGWKVALAALDIDAAQWNNILSGEGSDRGISDPKGLYKQLKNDCSQNGSLGGSGCDAGKPFHFGYDSGGFSDAVVEGIEAGEFKYFYITPDPVTGYGLMNFDWKDVPSTMYSGGLLDMHAHSNMNGIVYTPGPLEWEAGNSSYDGGVHMSYVSGSFVTGYGSYVKNNNSGDRYVLAFDRQAVDNVSIDQEQVVVLRRYAWQELR